MKNRKIVMVAFLLVAVMCIGVGFASVADTLNANGNVNVNASDFGSEYDGYVYFDASSAATAGNVTVALASGEKPDTATITISEGALKTGTMSVTAKLVVKNDYSKAANVTASVTTAPTSPLLSVTVTPSATADPNGTAEFTVTVTLASIPAADISADSFVVTLSAAPAA